MPYEQKFMLVIKMNIKNILEILKHPKSIYLNIKHRRKVTRNFWDYYFVKLGVKKSAVIRFYDSEKFLLTKQNLNQFFEREFQKKIMLDKPKGFDFKKQGGKIVFSLDHLKFITNKALEGCAILETFVEKQYDWLDVKGKTVVDVGANIGDTAVYFSKVKHAKQVIAFEPYPYTYKMAVENIKINKVKNVVLLNEGVGKQNDFMIIDASFESDSGSALKNFKKGKKVKINSLESIVRKYKIENAVLKMDCEGCEYDIILNSSSNVLRKFDQMIIETHYGCEKIEDKLKNSGFEVRHVNNGVLLSKVENEEALVLDFVFASKK